MARGGTKAKPKSTSSAGKSKSDGGGGEIQQHKSPAEFFADNQAIAGFDNLGKFHEKEKNRKKCTSVND